MWRCYTHSHECYPTQLENPQSPHQGHLVLEGEFGLLPIEIKYKLNIPFRYV
jgi:hypothetical protein